MSYSASVVKARTRPRWWLGVVRLLLLLDTLALALVVVDAPQFKVARVILAGLDRTDPSQVMRVSRLEGQNVLLLSVGKVEQVIARLPTVKQATVTRQLPNQVTIAVQERQPRVIWESKGSKYLVDDEGVVIGPATGNESLLKVVDRGGRALAAGERVESEAIAVAEKLSGALPREFGIDVQTYHYTWPAGLTLVTTKGWRLNFGGAEDYDYKLAVLKAILQTIQQRNARFEMIDLRSRERPYFR